MCNMAAYAGCRAAAPILLQMLESQEALGGGHYTGIATLSGGTIHLLKVIGPVSELLRRHPEALEMPGTVGIAHSRTPGIDSDAWAQPFLSYNGQVVYCANGAAGQFKATDYNSAYLRDKAEGIVYRTSIAHPAGTYPVMADGCCVHSSEVNANVVRRRLAAGGTLRDALAAMLAEYPSEIAGLALAVQEPESVSAVRLNQPLMWGRDESGFYLATAAFALENEHLEWVNPVPSASVLTMTREAIALQALDGFASFFVPCEPRHRVFQALDAMLARGGDYCVNDFCEEAKKCWPAGKLATANMVAYEFLREELATGTLESWLVETPGSGAGLVAPQRRYRRKRGGA